MVHKTSSIEITAALANQLADKLQTECLNARKLLFWDPLLGYNHNMGGVRTEASLQQIESHINNISGGKIRFSLRSHRQLWFEIDDVDRLYIINAPRQYHIEYDSKELNPYLRVAKELRKAARERTIMHQTYEYLHAA